MRMLYRRNSVRDTTRVWQSVKLVLVLVSPNPDRHTDVGYACGRALSTETP